MPARPTRPALLAFLGGLLLLAASAAIPPILAHRLELTAAMLAYGRGLLAVGGVSLLACAGLAIWPAARGGPPPALRLARPWLWLLAGAIGLYVLVYCAFTFQRHAHFNSAIFDLGVQDQVVWNTAHGRPYASSIEVENYLADHFKPLVALLAPLYWLTPSVYWLLGFQTLALALGAIPVYRLAARRLGGGLYGLLFGLVYLLYPPVGYVNRFDFHWEATVVLWLLAAMDAAERRRWRWLALWLALTLLSKEEMGLTVAVFGLWLAWPAGDPVRRRVGAAWGVVGLAYSAIIILWVMPAIRQAPPDTLGRYAWLGETPGQMLVTLLTRPQAALSWLLSVDALRYLVSLGGPLAFLPIGHSLALSALPAILYNLLSSEISQRVAYYHYVAPIIPFLFGGAIGAAGKLLARAERQRAGWVGWALCVVLPLFVAWHTVGVNNPLADDGAVQPAWSRLPNESSLAAALALIPPDAAVLTTNYIGPHLSQRTHLAPLFEPEQTGALEQVDFAVFNVLDLRGSRPWRCADYAGILAAAAELGYGLVYHQDGVVIIRRDGGDRAALANLTGTLCR